MFLSKACIYGIQAAIYTAVNFDKGKMSIKKISDDLNISFHFLTKVLQELSNHGIIESSKGPRGGVNLAKSPEIITLNDLIVAIDGESIFNQCLLGLLDCGSAKPCTVHATWAAIRNEFESKTKKLNLNYLAKNTTEFDLRIGKNLSGANSDKINIQNIGLI